MEEDNPYLRRVTVTLDSVDEENNQHKTNPLLSMYLGLNED